MGTAGGKGGRFSRWGAGRMVERERGPAREAKGGAGVVPGRPFFCFRAGEKWGRVGEAERTAERGATMKNKAGFTLIEILVVLGVIGLLAGILVPAVSSGMAKARRAQCLGNLKALGAAFSAYGADHKGKMPSVGGGADYATMSEMVQGMFEDGYMETLETWVCPTDTGRKACRGESAESFKSGENCSYVYFEGYNPLKVTGSLSEMPLACDRARGGGKAKLTDTDNHGANCRNVLYLGGAAMTLKTADKANDVMKVELPEGVSLVE